MALYHKKHDQRRVLTDREKLNFESAVQIRKLEEGLGTTNSSNNGSVNFPDQDKEDSSIQHLLNPGSNGEIEVYLNTHEPFLQKLGKYFFSIR